MTHDPAPHETMPAHRADEPIHPHYAAPPPSKEVAGEPRLLHAMMVATWVGRLIDPLIHPDHHLHQDEKKLERREHGA